MTFIMRGVRIQELEMNIDQERAQMVRHNIYEIENFYPTIVDKQFKDKLNMRLTEIVASNIDFVIGSLSPATKQYTPTEINEMKEKVENIYKLSKNNQPSTYFYSSKHSKIRGIEYGRLFSKESLQGLKREIRNTIVDKENCVDIDMVNAHPCIMNQVASLLHVNAPVLNEYVTDRERLLRTIGTDCHESAKEIPLAIINGGIRSSLHPTISWLKGLEDEIQDIYKAFIQTQIGSEISADVHRRDPDNYNKLGSTLNLLLCKIENEILSQCVFYCQSKNIEVYTLCFDGFIASRTDDSILAELENHVYTTLGLRMRFSIKSFDKCLSDDLIQQLLNISNTIYPINMTKCESAFDAMTKKMRDSLFDNKIDSGFVRKKYGMKLFPFEVIIKDHIIRWLERIYGLSEIDLHFDGKNLIFKANQRKGKKYQCFCLKPNCHLIGDVIFHILWNGMHAVIAQCTFAPHCDKYVDITGALAIKKNVLSQLNNELFDASRELVQSVYTMPGVHVLQHTNVNQKIDLRQINSDIIIQTGYAGYGKTTNVFDYIRFMSKTPNLICVVISNLAIQNTNYCRNSSLHSINNLIRPAIHCMGMDILHHINNFRQNGPWKEGYPIKSTNKLEYPKTGHTHTYIINSKSLQDSKLLPHIDILFIDEFIQILKSVSNSSDKRTHSLFVIFIELIRRAKKVMICDIKFDPEIINFIRLIRQDHITHFKICDTRMKFGKITLTDDANLLVRLINLKRAKFISSDSRHFIEWLYYYHIDILKIKPEDCLMIVGKDFDQSVEDRLKHVKRILRNSKKIKYIFCSPAVTSSIDIKGKRIAIGVRFSNVISKSDSINALLRARKGTNLYLFNFARDYKRGYLPENDVLNDQQKCAYRMNRNDERGVRFEELMSETVFKNILFNCYYTYQNYRAILADKVGYKIRSNTNPVSQTWISDAYGIELIDPDMLEHVMYKINQDLESNGKPVFEFKLESRPRIRRQGDNDELTFKFPLGNGFHAVYSFIGLHNIITMANELNRDFKELKKSLGDCEDDLHTQFVLNYQFLYDFYHSVSQVWTDFTRIIKQNQKEIIATENYTEQRIVNEQKVNTQNLMVSTLIGFLKKRYNEILPFKQNLSVDILTYCRLVLGLYFTKSDYISVKSLIQISRHNDTICYKNAIKQIKDSKKKTNRKPKSKPENTDNSQDPIEVKVFDCVTDHTQPPFNELTEDIYEHDWIVDFMQRHNIPPTSRVLSNLIPYIAYTQDTTVNKKRVQLRWLIKADKANIHVKIFEKNEYFN